MNPSEITVALGALAQETRLALYRLLVQRGPQGVPAGTLSDKLDVPASSLSFHLAQLRHAGLITQRRVGRQLFYATDYQTMNGLMAYLTENCCGGEACAPACSPGSTLKGNSDEAPARARQRR